jgi:hypothetical protein
MTWKYRSRTQHAADGGYAPRYLSFIVALGFFRFDGDSIHRSECQPLGGQPLKNMRQRRLK